jgi:hypothetical protein
MTDVPKNAQAPNPPWAISQAKETTSDIGSLHGDFVGVIHGNHM